MLYVDLNVRLTATHIYQDINRVTKGRADPDLAKILVDNSRETTQWLMDNGARFMLSFNRQAFLVNGKYKFWGGMVMNLVDQGKGLYKWHCDLARSHGVDIWYEAPATELITDEFTGDVIGVKIYKDGRYQTVQTVGGVILACGGFQASPELRTKYLGPGWDLAHVRGCKYNTGDGHLMAQSIGAKLKGNYSGCHAVAWDGNSPIDEGNRVLTNQYTKSGYPLGLMLNALGNRFVDEGFDLRNFTYAVFGKEILKQPNGIAFQVWDAEGAKWLRKEEYADDITTNIRADTLEELADKLAKKGLRDKRQFVATIKEYNESVEHFQTENKSKNFDPAIRDGVSTQSSKKSLALAKSNWAMPLKKGPFQAVEVTTGITFTFGGLGVDPYTGSVLREATRKPIKGLYCTGEILGGLFWDNYPGGSGLMMGSIMGRKVGKQAAEAAVRATRQGGQIRSQL
jgi:succinate dehydrogenase/fumarate reductase flavoprotein subunit